MKLLPLKKALYEVNCVILAPSAYTLDLRVSVQSHRMSSGNAPVPSVLDSTASGVAESSGLGLVSALLEVKTLWRGMNG